MPIIGCTKEDNCKRDAFLKSRQFAAERAAGLLHCDLIPQKQYLSTKMFISYDARMNQTIQLFLSRN